MTLLRQLLLLPLLTPLLAVLVVGAINPTPALSLRLLTWQTPALGLGAWLMLAAGGGSLLSALGTGLALGTAQPSDLRRRLRRPAQQGAEPWQRWEPSEPAPPSDWPEQPGSAGPARAAGEPSPTVAVPYRVIRRGQATSPAESLDPQPIRTAAVGDGWGDPEPDDW